MKNIMKLIKNKLGISDTWRDGKGNQKLNLNYLLRRLDMNKKNAYIYFSGATDRTGQALADALKINGVKKKPTGKDVSVVIGWGAKTKEAMSFPKGVVVLNHPNYIKANRNKFKTLETLRKAKVPVADFVSADGVMAALKSNKVNLPLVGRKKYHQGGKGFWTCITKGMVKKAIQEGAQYFQEFIPVENEYRIHMFGDERIYAQRKVERKNMQEAFKEQHGEKIKHMAEKNNVNIDENTMNYALERVGKNVAESPDMIIRSNSKGWRFSRVTKETKVLKELDKIAADALKAINLDFGAVDCCVDEDGKMWVLEVNSGPGLEESSFDVYKDKFEAKLKEIMNPTPVKEAKPKADAVKAKKTTATSQASSGSKKAELKAKASFISELVEEADEEEAEVLERLMRKTFGK